MQVRFLNFGVMKAAKDGYDNLKNTWRLEQAVRKGDVATIKETLPLVKNPNRPYHPARFKLRTLLETALLFCPVGQPLSETIKALLAEPKTEVPEEVILAAVNRSHVVGREPLELLLREGGERVQLHTSDALVMVAESDQEAILAMMLSYPSVRKVIDAISNRSTSNVPKVPLEAAIDTRNPRAVRLLIDAGASITTLQCRIPTITMVQYARNCKTRHPNDKAYREIVEIIETREHELSEQNTLLRASGAPPGPTETLLRVVPHDGIGGSPDELLHVTEE